MNTVRTTDRIVLDDEAYADVLDVVAQTSSDPREITDGTARTIAAWWQSPGSVGRYLATLASGLPVDVEQLLDDIAKTRQDLRASGERPEPRDLRALDCLATWAIRNGR